MSLSPKLDWSLANPKWASEINPLLANPITQGHVISGITLVTGANTINHGLGRKLVGYIIVLNSSSVTFYDNQASNQKPNLTLILNASGATTVTLYVF